MYIHINIITYIYIYIYIKYIYKYIHIFYINIRNITEQMFPNKYYIFSKIKIKNNIFFIKDVHRKTAPDACPETSVRVCFGGNSRFTFQELKSILFFGAIL